MNESFVKGRGRMKLGIAMEPRVSGKPDMSPPRVLKLRLRGRVLEEGTFSSKRILTCCTLCVVDLVHENEFVFKDLTCWIC